MSDTNRPDGDPLEDRATEPIGKTAQCCDDPQWGKVPRSKDSHPNPRKRRQRWYWECLNCRVIETPSEKVAPRKGNIREDSSWKSDDGGDKQDPSEEVAAAKSEADTTESQCCDDPGLSSLPLRKSKPSRTRGP